METPMHNQTESSSSSTLDVFRNTTSTSGSSERTLNAPVAPSTFQFNINDLKIEPLKKVNRDLLVSLRDSLNVARSNMKPLSRAPALEIVNDTIELILIMKKRWTPDEAIHWKDLSDDDFFKRILQCFEQDAKTGDTPYEIVYKHLNNIRMKNIDKNTMESIANFFQEIVKAKTLANFDTFNKDQHKDLSKLLIKNLAKGRDDELLTGTAF